MYAAEVACRTAAVFLLSFLFLGCSLAKSSEGEEIGQNLHQIAELISRIEGLLQNWSSTALQVTSVCAESFQIFVKAKRWFVDKQVDIVKETLSKSSWPEPRATHCECFFFFFCGQVTSKMLLLASAPLHTQDTEIGLGALVWQPQPSFSISDRSCLMAEKSRQNASRIARQKMKTGCERHGERESERRREDRATKLGPTRKTIRCYQSEQ